MTELRKSDFLRAIQLLEEEEDINQITEYFSYEHFYVIYCKFWELDRDHDLFISKEDLARHSEHGKWEHNLYSNQKINEFPLLSEIILLKFRY